MTVLLTCAILTSTAWAAPTVTSGVELTGLVRNEHEGPLAGATVFISTAAPRQGVGVL
jgi:hypothetical protein